MPFPTRVQPIDLIQGETVKPLVLKSRLKRLFDRPFNGVLKISLTEKQPATGGEKEPVAAATTAPAVAEFEPSSVCLDKMVRNFIEDGNEKQSAVPSAKCGRSRCNCFHGNSNDTSDDEVDIFSESLSANSSFSDPSDTLKSLVPCASLVERNLLADTSKIVEKNNKTCKPRDEMRKNVVDGLIALGYDASVCRSKWDKTPTVPAGEYEYIDVVIKGERLIIDIDFRSEFEIARSTSSYKAILQILPQVFVGKPDRLLQIIFVATEAARLSLKKKGMHVAPWRKPDYVKSKWLGPHTRLIQMKSGDPETIETQDSDSDSDSEFGELNLIFSEEPKSPEKETEPASTPWQLPAVKTNSLERGNKTVITGLASLLNERQQEKPQKG